MAKGKVPSSSGESTPTESTLKRVTGSERQSVMSQKVCIMLTPYDLITDIDCNFKAKETSSEVDLPSTGNANQMGLSETGNQSHKGDAVHLADASILEDEVRSPSNGFSPGNFYGSKKQNMSPRIRIFSPSAQKNLREERSKSLSKHSLGVKRKNKKQRNSSEVRKMQRTSNMARQSESSEGKQRSVATGKKTCGEFADSTKIISKAENHDESKDEPKLCKSEINGVESNFTEEKRFSSQSGCAFEQSSNTSVGAMSSDSSPTLVNVASSNASEVESVGSEVSLYSGPGSVMDGLFLRKNGNEYFFSNLLDSDTQNTEGFASHKFARESIINGVTMLNPSSACDNIEGRTEEPPISCDVADDSQSSFSISLPSPDTSESDFILKLSEKEADSSSTKSSPEHQAPITKYFKSMTGPKCRTKLMTSSVSFSGMSSVENSPEVNTRISPSRRRKVGKRQEQMYLDLGQKDFGHVTCPTCGMVYTKAQPDDEAEHIRHHKRFVSGLRFTGWKNESLIKEYQDGRVIMVGPDDHPLHLKKVEEIRKVVDSELGFVADVPNVQSEAKTFVFITAKKVVGCTVAVQIDQGYPVLPSPGESSTPEKQIAAWCCSTTPTPAQCGISRIWVHSRYRRKKVATRLLDCVRMNFLYGCVIPRELVAFSDPTPDGKRLAQSYTGTSQFLVFR